MICGDLRENRKRWWKVRRTNQPAAPMSTSAFPVPSCSRPSEALARHRKTARCTEGHPEFAGNRTRGQEIAAKFCAACHGADGHGISPQFPNLAAHTGKTDAQRLNARSLLVGTPCETSRSHTRNGNQPLVLITYQLVGMLSHGSATYRAVTVGRCAQQASRCGLLDHPSEGLCRNVR